MIGFDRLGAIKRFDTFFIQTEEDYEETHNEGCKEDIGARKRFDRLGARKRFDAFIMPNNRQRTRLRPVMPCYRVMVVI